MKFRYVGKFLYGEIHWWNGLFCKSTIFKLVKFIRNHISFAKSEIKSYLTHTYIKVAFYEMWPFVRHWHLNSCFLFIEFKFMIWVSQIYEQFVKTNRAKKCSLNHSFAIYPFDTHSCSRSWLYKMNLGSFTYNSRRHQFFEILTPSPRSSSLLLNKLYK